MEKASTICGVVPLIVTIRSGHEASEMFIRAPLCTQDVNFVRQSLNIYARLNMETDFTIDKMHKISVNRCPQRYSVGSIFIKLHTTLFKSV